MLLRRPFTTVHSLMIRGKLGTLLLSTCPRNIRHANGRKSSLTGYYILTRNCLQQNSWHNLYLRPKCCAFLPPSSLPVGLARSPKSQLVNGTTDRRKVCFDQLQLATRRSEVGSQSSRIAKEREGRSVDIVSSTSPGSLLL